MDLSIAAAQKVPVANEPTIRTCIGCGRAFTNELGFCPSCGRMVSDKDPYDPQQENTIPQYSNPGHGSCQYQQSEYPSGKDPRMARVLAGFGFLGFMGIGHIYMGKFVKGIILLFAGGFLALMSAASIFLIFQPSEFPVEIKITTAAIFTVPFLLILIWQFFDAPNPG